VLAAFLQPLAVDLPVQQLRLHLKRDGIEATAVRRLLGHDSLQLRDEIVEWIPPHQTPPRPSSAGSSTARRCASPKVTRRARARSKA